MPADPNEKIPRIARQGVPAAYASGAGLSGAGFVSWMTAGALVVALILGLALPAKAERNDDLIKGLAAALVVGLIVNELSEAPKATPVKQPKVPAVCAITIHGDTRSVTLYPERCLRSEGFDQRLPRACANTASIFGREDRVYSASCLRDAGFRVVGN